MPDLGPYATAVISSYAVTIGLLALLVWWSFRQAARARARLEQIEGRKDG